MGKSLGSSGKKSAVAKKARFSFDAETNGKGKIPTGTNGNHPATTPAEHHAGLPGGGVTIESPIIAEKIKDLLRLATDQGYLTYDDINDALPDEVVTPEVLDAIYSKLRSLHHCAREPGVLRSLQPRPSDLRWKNPHLSFLSGGARSLRALARRSRRRGTPRLCCAYCSGERGPASHRRAGIPEALAIDGAHRRVSRLACCLQVPLILKQCYLSVTTSEHACRCDRMMVKFPL